MFDNDFDIAGDEYADERDFGMDEGADADEVDYDCIFEDDGQPDEYTEWQDYMGGDDWDHGQYDCTTGNNPV